MIPFEEIDKRVKSTGAVALSATMAEEVDQDAWQRYVAWLESGNASGMHYLSNWSEIRRDPHLLLEGAQTIITIAYSYRPPEFRANEDCDGNGHIACYAYGRDYHDELRKLLKPVIKDLKERYGGEYRICIDSAPILERYWAVKSGLGYVGRNGVVIVPGHGSMLFLVEIIMTETTDRYGKPLDLNCLNCGLCQRICPGGAINEQGEINSRRCLSYLTIEHAGEWQSDETLQVLSTPEGKHTIYGCDRCIRCCPHNKEISPTSISAFHPSETMLKADKNFFESLTKESFTTYFPRTPMRRAGLPSILRNIRNK